MGKRVAVITKDRDRQHEALRTGLGLLLESHSVSVFVLNHEIEPSEHSLDNLGFIDEMGGDRYSDQLARRARSHRPVLEGSHHDHPPHL
jgi:hypothetical protein